VEDGGWVEGGGEVQGGGWVEQRAQQGMRNRCVKLYGG
jgi:hypothetical protein